MLKAKNEYEVLAEMICELTRNCNVKEDYFAASFNLSPSEVRLLMLFTITDTYSIKELREKLKLTSGRITHILTSLEDKKLLIRIPVNIDKRNIIVKLLPKAKPLIKNLHQNYRQLHKNILESVDKNDIIQIQSSMAILLEVLKKWVNKI